MYVKNGAISAHEHRLTGHLGDGVFITGFTCD
jgi:hypothetical protein